ncbi:TetR/AcrR family transcriptional regulator [Agromyces sp. LHK192]|uniref:TetR/AcrR family transcriptional regulator n=1 Tax=Agromyces sp. LHK192 TaxID=2498704 RepID=UPI000FD9A471|nr:TetR/AcrR family transcriptional regulator [Agromyces sp. LHK192]
MPDIDLILGADPGRRRAIRTEPTQRRSTQRLDALLDAAAELVDEIGFDRLTTQMVAERAGASIGTVYRYFPDRVAILHGLRDRCVERFRARVAARIDEIRPETWWDLIVAALDASVDLYRDEPGFGVVHGDDRELSADGGEPEFAARMANLIISEFGEPADAETLRFRLGIALELGETLVHRAFSRNPEGDARYLSEARVVVREYLATHLEHASHPKAA